MPVVIAALALLGGLIGAVVIVTYQHATRPRLSLRYEILSSAPLVPFETKPGDPLRVMVRKELLPALRQDIGPEEYQDAGRVYGFRVLFKNTGTQTIKGDETAPGVDLIFELGEYANVLAIDVEQPPMSPGEVVKEEHHQGAPNVARVWLKYLNKDRDVVVSLQSVGNFDLTCRVDARAPDLPAPYDARAVRGKRLRAVFIVIAVLLMIPFVNRSNLGSVSVWT